MERMSTSLFWAVLLTGAVMLAMAAWHERRHWTNAFLAWRRGGLRP